MKLHGISPSPSGSEDEGDSLEESPIQVTATENDGECFWISYGCTELCLPMSFLNLKIYTTLLCFAL